MNHKHAAAVGQTMDSMLLHLDVAISAVKFGEQIIVIARDINGPCAFARFAQNLLNDVVMLLRPINTAPQLPDVDQIAHNVESFKVVFAEEVEQCPSVRATRSQMHI